MSKHKRFEVNVSNAFRPHPGLGHTPLIIENYPGRVWGWVSKKLN